MCGSTIVFENFWSILDGRADEDRNFERYFDRN